MANIKKICTSPRFKFDPSLLPFYYKKTKFQIFTFFPTIQILQMDRSQKDKILADLTDLQQLKKEGCLPRLEDFKTHLSNIKVKQKEKI